MKVQVGVELVTVEGLKRFGMNRGNVAVADVLADHRTVFGFH
jgi:hypothetical protein